MKTLLVDLETYWSDTHSLTKMHPIEYVLHPETEIQSIAVKSLNGPAQVLFGEEVFRWAKETDFSDVLLVGHNLSHFDSMLLAWRLGIKPKAWGCTLAMAREAGLAKTVGGSLAKVSKALGLAEKLDLGAVGTKGKKLKDFTSQEIAAMREYNARDVEICADVFTTLYPDPVNLRSLQLIDMTIRMLVEPQLEQDTPLLEKTLADLRVKKANLLTDVGRFMFPDIAEVMPVERLREEAKTVLSSAPKFAAYLKAKGVPVPMKASPTNPDKTIPALAKTDEGMQALLEHEDEEVAAAAAARLSVRSTILETRLETFLRVGRMLGGKLPVALNYYGADNTGRWSGGMSMNQQNLPRVDPDKPKATDALRRGLRAPKGSRVVVADLSGIELRVNHFLWHVQSTMDMFRADPAEADPYVDFAMRLYGIPREEVVKNMRQVGKVAHLGLGFGTGAETFQRVAKLMAGIDLPLHEAQEIVDLWRATYPEIVAGWKRCDWALQWIDTERDEHLFPPIDPGALCFPCKEGIRTPRGMIRYPEARYAYGEGYTCAGRNGTRVKLFGAKVNENIVQHLAREVLADYLLKIQRRYPIALIVHDEVVLVVPEDEAQEALEFANGIMRTPPTWWPELVTWSKGGVSVTYGDAK